jgi:hypothetical protein
MKHEAKTNEACRAKSAKVAKEFFPSLPSLPSRDILAVSSVAEYFS